MHSPIHSIPIEVSETDHIQQRDTKFILLHAEFSYETHSNAITDTAVTAKNKK